jgi:hypothetical protein
MMGDLTEDVIERGRRVCGRLAMRDYDPDMEEAAWAIAALSREVRRLRELAASLPTPQPSDEVDG